MGQYVVIVSTSGESAEDVIDYGGIVMRLFGEKHRVVLSQSKHMWFGSFPIRCQGISEKACVEGVWYEIRAKLGRLYTNHITDISSGPYTRHAKVESSHTMVHNGIAEDAELEKMKDALIHAKDDGYVIAGMSRRCMVEQITMLSEAILALKRDPPKVHVMVDHAERAIDAMRDTIKKIDSMLDKLCARGD